MKIRNDRSGFRDWLSKVIVCTEQNYDTKKLEKIVKTEPTFHYREKYMELLSDVIKELLSENKQNKLQTFGYTMEDMPHGNN